jgi:two-component system chemotaxis response regulator CheY
MTANIPEKVIHFLVVDDDEHSRATVVEYLRSMGHQKITEARDGAEASKFLDRDSSINFIISDWDMPLMNGLNLLHRVKGNPRRAHQPFLIMTSPVSQEAEKIVAAAENLVDAYVIKPFRSQTLKDKIDKILQTPVRGPQKQALVVDDDPDAREMIIEYLKNMGFKDVLGMADGKIALDYLVQNPSRVGLIVSDWEMPEMNGIELLKHCKAMKSLIDIPFLMITSQSSIERMKIMQAAKANVDHYLLKPFSGSDMRKRVEVLLEKARTRGQVQELLIQGQDHYEHARLQSAQKSFEEALALDADQDIALRGMGDVLVKLKGMEAALPYYKKAVEANPVNPKGYIKLAMAYEQVGLIEKALALLQSALLNISFSADLHFHLGRLYNKKNMVIEAQSEFEKTLEIQLDHQEARLMLEMIVGTRKE